MTAVATTEIAKRIERHRPGDYGAGRRELKASLLGLFASSLIKPPRMTGSEWAEKFGRIPKSTGAESGPVTLYGYQRGLLDAMCDPNVPRITVMKAARVGYTRCFTLAIGYHLHHDPTLCAVAQPVKEDAEDFGGTEIAPMLRETPVLKRMLRPVRKGEKQDKNVFFKLSNGASCRIVGAAADDAFRRYSARFLAADEIDGDGWTPKLRSQGEKLKLFWTRGETFWNRKLVVGSTPLVEETSRIAALWAKSDQRRYHVPCPQCSSGGALDGWQYLDWGGKDEPHGLKWETDDAGRLKSVWYVGTCGCIIDESHKAWMDARGEWRVTNPDGDHVGFQLWTGMSLNLNASWSSIVQEWLDAQADPSSLVQPFVNLRLGRTYKAAYGHQIKAHTFLERAEDYGAEVPAWVQFLTFGGDVQSGANARIEISIYGWGKGLEGCLIGHFVVPGDPAEQDVWASVDALLKREFTRADGHKMVLQAGAIDSGGHHTAETYTFCNERRHRRVWAIKGLNEALGRRGPVWPRKPSDKLGRVWYMISGNAARDWAYGSLAVVKPGARRIHFPKIGVNGSRPIDEEFFAQLTREKLVTRKGRYTEWEKVGVREAGVCFVYAYVAVCGLQAHHGLFLEIGKASAPTPVIEVSQAASAAGDETLAVPTAHAQQPAPPAAQPATEPTPYQPEQQRTGFVPRRSGWMQRWRD